MQVTGCRERFKGTAETQSAQRKIIIRYNKLLKRVLETAREVFSVKKRDNNCSLPFTTFAYSASLRLETSMNLSFDLIQDSELTEPFRIY